MSGDDNTLDLGGSFVDLVNLGISEELLDWVLGVETVTTEDLNSISSNLVGSVTSEARKQKTIRSKM